MLICDNNMCCEYVFDFGILGGKKDERIYRLLNLCKIFVFILMFVLKICLFIKFIFLFFWFIIILKF